MSNSISNKLVNVAMVGVGIYIAYKLLQKITAPIVDPLAQGIANAYLWATLPGAVDVNAQINLLTTA